MHQHSIDAHQLAIAGHLPSGQSKLVATAYVGGLGRAKVRDRACLFSDGPEDIDQRLIRIRSDRQQMTKLTVAEKAEVYEYTPIRDLTTGSSLNFYGRVILFKPPRKTRGPDYAMSLIVVDDSLVEDDSNDGLSVSLFRPDPDLFPKIKGIGDVVQFRHFKVQMFENCLQALSTNWSAFTVFHQVSDGTWIADPEHPINDTELAVLQRLTAKQRPTAPSSPSKRSSRPTLRISQMIPHQFCDFVGRVVKVYPAVSTEGPDEGKGATRVVIVLTDYTENRQVSANTDAMEIDPRLCSSALAVTCWDNQAAFAGQLSQGQAVLITNLHVRMSDGSLVAALHGDERPHISALPEGCAEAIALDRARAAFDELKARSSERQVAHISATRLANRLTGSPSTPIASILSSDLPCFKYVVKGRVVDYYPKRASEFVRCSRCEYGLVPLSLSSGGLQCLHGGGDRTFVFAILLRDCSTSQHLPVLLSGSDAVDFFGGLSPTAHSAYHDTVQQCMDRLLGSPVDSLFAVKAYTIEGGERRYSLFGTTVSL